MRSYLPDVGKRFDSPRGAICSDCWRGWVFPWMIGWWGEGWRIQQIPLQLSSEFSEDRTSLKVGRIKHHDYHLQIFLVLEYVVQTTNCGFTTGVTQAIFLGIRMWVACPPCVCQWTGVALVRKLGWCFGKNPRPKAWKVGIWDDATSPPRNLWIFLRSNTKALTIAWPWRFLTCSSSTLANFKPLEEAKKRQSDEHEGNPPWN